MVVICQIPDNVTATASSMTSSPGEAVKAVKTTPLMTAEDGMEAMRKGARRILTTQRVEVKVCFIAPKA